MNGNDTHRLPLFVSTTWIMVMGLAALPIANILRQLSDGFWLDEIISWWIVDSSLWNVFARATEFHSQSPLYYWILWMWSQLVGHSELAFRSLSLLLFLSAIVIFYRCLRSWLGTETACVAAAICISSPIVGIFVHARPYGLAFLFVSLAFATALRFCGKPSAQNLVFYTFSALLAIYAHYVYAIALVPIFMLMWLQVPRWRWGLIMAKVFCVLGAAPLVWHMHMVVNRHLSSNWMHIPTPTEIVCHLQPPFMVLGVALWFAFRQPMTTRGTAEIRQRNLLQCFLALWFFPPISLWVLSHGLGTAINAERYVAFEVLGVAGVLSIALKNVASRTVRSIMLVLIIIVGSAYPRPVFNHGDRWQDACRRAEVLQRERRASEEWILYDGMNESGMTSWHYSFSRRPFLLAPLAYCGEGQREALIAPFWEYQTELRDKIVARVLADGRPRVYIGRWHRNLTGIRDVLLRQGWSVVDESVGGIVVGVFSPPST